MLTKWQDDVPCITGENGEPVYTSMAEKSAADRSTGEYGFNMVVSDKIAMDRAVPDTRLDEWVDLTTHITPSTYFLWSSRFPTKISHY